MEQWMQQSAETGNVPVKEADWQQMKQLLQPEKKRRFIFLWWLIGLLLVGAALLLTWQSSNEKSKPSNSVIVNNNNTKENQNKKNEVNKDKPSSPKAGSEIQTGDKNKNALSTPLEKENQEKKTPHTSASTVIKQKAGSNNKAAASTDANKKEPEHKEPPQEKGSNGAEDKNIVTIITNTAQAPVQITATTNTHEAPRVDAPGNKQTDTVLANDKSKNDNIALKQPGDSTAVKKKSKNKKGEWLLSAGYYTGAMPVKAKGLVARITYNYSLKHFTIHPSLYIQQFSPRELQQYNGITRITQNPGTTFIMLNTRTVTFSPANGIILAPALSVGYNFKKLNLSIGANKGVVINSNNKVISTVDTISFSAAPLPATIKVTPPYNSSGFNGKKYTALDIGLRYSLPRKIHLGINYAKQIGNNKLEGIVDDKKKRAALFFYFGLKL